MGRGHQLNSVALQHSMGPLDKQNLNLVGKCLASSNNIFYLNTVSFKANWDLKIRGRLRQRKRR